MRFKYAGEVLASWVKHYIDPIEHAQLHKGVTVSANTADEFICHINANGHQQLADEPISVGGSNLGPTPYDYLAVPLPRIHQKNTLCQTPKKPAFPVR